MSKFKHLKAGDAVYVAPQKSRNRNPSPYASTVLRVGRKYGYVMHGHYECAFDLNTGYSVHKEGNERYNGFGFDVWESREVYEQFVRDEQEHQRLAKRLLDERSYRTQLQELPPTVVQELHAVLDKWEASKEAKGGAT